MSRQGITVAIPHKKNLNGMSEISTWTLDCYKHLCEVTAKRGYDIHEGLGFATSNTPVTREGIASNMKGDWLCMIDADMVFPPDTLNRALIAAMTSLDGEEALTEPRKIICAPCARATWPHNTCFGNLNAETGNIIPHRYGHEWGDEDIKCEKTHLIKVDASGFGFVLIHRSVFDIMPAPWFQLNVVYEPTGGRYGHDYLFCLKAKDLGIQTYIDFHMGQVGHLGAFGFSLADTRRIAHIPEMAEKLATMDTNVEKMLGDDHDINYDYPEMKHAGILPGADDSELNLAEKMTLNPSEPLPETRAVERPEHSLIPVDAILEKEELEVHEKDSKPEEKKFPEPPSVDLKKLDVDNVLDEEYKHITKGDGLNPVDKCPGCGVDILTTSVTKHEPGCPSNKPLEEEKDA